MPSNYPVTPQLPTPRSHSYPDGSDKISAQTTDERSLGKVRLHIKSYVAEFKFRNSQLAYTPSHKSSNNNGHSKGVFDSYYLQRRVGENVYGIARTITTNNSWVTFVRSERATSLHKILQKPQVSGPGGLRK